IKRCMMHCQMQDRMNGERNYEHCSHWKHERSCGREEDEDGEKCIRKEIIIKDGQEMNEACEGKEGMGGEKECCKKMMKKDSVIIRK
ncbi:MAG: hypothetical protein ACXVP4_10920, partial [Bacteroidia bacterium]